MDYLRRAQIKGGIKNELILPESIYKNNEFLDKLLQKIKIVDPAVGSGAFPVGMMNEIIKSTRNTKLLFHEREEIRLPIKKRNYRKFTLWSGY